MFTESWITHELNESPEALGLLGLFTALPTIILNLFKERINNSIDTEFQEANNQVKKIAMFRLEEIIK